MGFRDLFMSSNTPKVKSILPAYAKSEIQQNRLPIVRTGEIFLNVGEICHYIDNAIYQKAKKVRVANRKSGGYKTPGIFSGTSFFFGDGQTVTREQSEYESINGTLSITNQRLIFSSPKGGFVYTLDKLISLKPYQNAVQIQLENVTLTVFVPDGSIVATVLHNLR